MKPASRPVAVVALAVILLVIVLAIFAFITRPASGAPVDPPSATRAPSLYTPPPLPAVNFMPARPMGIVREAYRFAADHPEVPGCVPCSSSWRIDPGIPEQRSSRLSHVPSA